jgi:F0F1-type ATP synthase membrane subunit b/b'
MGKVKNAISLAEKIVSEAKKEINKEREENLKKQAKTLLVEIQEAQRTVNLLEKQLKNFMREVEIN